MIRFIRMYNAHRAMTLNEFNTLLEENYNPSKTSMTLDEYLSFWKGRFISCYKNLIVPNEIPAHVESLVKSALNKALVNGAQTQSRQGSWTCATNFNQGRTAAQYADHMKNSVLWC